MRRTSKGNRAPLAPLHSNSLRADVPRKSVAKAEGKQSQKETKSSSVSERRVTKQAGKADPQAEQSAGSKTARDKSPTKSRKSVQLITTSAAPARSETLRSVKEDIKRAASCKPAASDASQLSRCLAKHKAAQQTAAERSAKPRLSAPRLAGASKLADGPKVQADAGAEASTQADALTSDLSALRHWQLPATPPSISAVLATRGAPAGAINVSRQPQYLQTQATPQSTVHGVGTPQDFSDVFDLDDVSRCMSMCHMSSVTTSSLRTHADLARTSLCQHTYSCTIPGQQQEADSVSIPTVLIMQAVAHQDAAFAFAPWATLAATSVVLALYAS